MNLSSVFFGVLFTAVGVLFWMGKIHPRLSAWQQMPQEEKDKINIVPLYQNIGEVITLSGIIFLLNGLWTGFQHHWFTGSMIAWMIVAGVDVWYISKSPRFRKN